MNSTLRPIRLFFLAVFTFAAVGMHGQHQSNIQEAAEILRNAQEQLEHKDFNFSIDYKIFANVNYSNLLTTSKAKYVKKENKLYYEKDGAKMLMTGDLCTTINLEDSTIIFSRNLFMQTPDVENMKNLLQQAEKIEVESPEPGVDLIYISLPPGIGMEKVSIELKDGWVSDIKMNGAANSGHGSIHISYQAASVSQIDEDMLNPQSYYKKVKNEYTGNGPYINFQVLNRHL